MEFHKRGGGFAMPSRAPPAPARESNSACSNYRSSSSQSSVSPSSSARSTSPSSSSSGSLIRSSPGGYNRPLPTIPTSSSTNRGVEPPPAEKKFRDPSASPPQPPPKVFTGKSSGDSFIGPRVSVGSTTSTSTPKRSSNSSTTTTTTTTTATTATTAATATETDSSQHRISFHRAHADFTPRKSSNASSGSKKSSAFTEARELRSEEAKLGKKLSEKQKQLEELEKDDHKYEDSLKDFFSEFDSENDVVVRTFECSLGGRVTAQGRIWFTPRAVYFGANVLGKTEKLFLSFDDITSIDKRNSAVVFRDSIEIATRTRNYVFQSFMRRDIAFGTLSELWEACLSFGGVNSLPPGYQGSLSSGEGFVNGSSSGSRKSSSSSSSTATSNAVPASISMSGEPRRKSEPLKSGNTDGNIQPSSLLGAHSHSIDHATGRSSSTSRLPAHYGRKSMSESSPSSSSSSLSSSSSTTTITSSSSSSSFANNSASSNAMTPLSASTMGDKMSVSSNNSNPVKKGVFSLLSGEAIGAKFVDVTWFTSKGGHIAGYCVVTNYSILFRPRENVDDVLKEVGSSQVIVPLGDVFKTRKIAEGMVTQMASGLSLTGMSASVRVCEIWCKSFRRIRLGFPPGTKQRQSFMELVNSGTVFNPPTAFAVTHFRGFNSNRPGTGSGGQFSNNSSNNSSNNISNNHQFPKWGFVYDGVAEYNRITSNFGGKFGPRWRASESNNSYRLCETYPDHIVVPQQITDGQLRNISAYRSKGRLPVLSWMNIETGACLCRCAQPHWGLKSRSRCMDDEEMLRAIARASSSSADGSELPVRVYDARPFANAVANAAKGQGYEDSSVYFSELEFCGIGNIHVMRKAHETLFESVTSPDIEDKVFSRVEPWLNLMSTIMRSVMNIVEDLKNGRSVVVHCSDGWDRTAQLSALTCVCIDPYYRTMNGMICLIEKEFLSFGFKAHQRLGFTPKKEDERSPILLQFVEGVFQLSQQNPASFEFNDSFLTSFLDCVYSARYGTCLCNCERERKELNLSEKTFQIWGALTSKKKSFWNPLYSFRDAKETVLRIVPASIRLRIWENYFLRSQPPSSPLRSEISPDQRTAALVWIIRNSRSQPPSKAGRQ